MQSRGAAQWSKQQEQRDPRYYRKKAPAHPEESATPGKPRIATSEPAEERLREEYAEHGEHVDSWSRIAAVTMTTPTHSRMTAPAPPLTMLEQDKHDESGRVREQTAHHRHSATAPNDSEDEEANACKSTTTTSSWDASSSKAMLPNTRSDDKQCSTRHP